MASSCAQHTSEAKQTEMSEFGKEKRFTARPSKETSQLIPWKASSSPKGFGKVFFFFKFIYFNWRLLTLQYCIGFAIHQHESATSVHVFPILNPPPSSLPLGHPSAPAPTILYPALNLDWQFVSYMILYMFQCHFPKSSHPLPLPQSPKDCSIHCVSFAVSHTGLSLPSF